MTWLPSIGLPELLLVLAVAPVIFGGSRLPEAPCDLGRAIRPAALDPTLSNDRG